MARMSIGWTRAWACLDLPLREALTRIDIDPDGMVDDLTVRSALEALLLQLDLEEDGARRAAERLGALEALLYASQLLATAHQARAACSNDFGLTFDLAELECHAREKARTALLAKAQVESVASLPSQWRWKAYRSARSL